MGVGSLRLHVHHAVLAGIHPSTNQTRTWIGNCDLVRLEGLHWTVHCGPRLARNDRRYVFLRAPSPIHVWITFKHLRTRYRIRGVHSYRTTTFLNRTAILYEHLRIYYDAQFRAISGMSGGGYNGSTATRARPVLGIINISHIDIAYCHLALEALPEPLVRTVHSPQHSSHHPSANPPLHLTTMLSTQMSYGNLAKLLVTGRARIRITSITSAQPRSISPSAAVVVRCRHNRDLLMYCGPLFSAQCLPSTSTSPGSWSWVSVLRSK